MELNTSQNCGLAFINLGKIRSLVNRWNGVWDSMWIIAAIVIISSSTLPVEASNGGPFGTGATGGAGGSIRDQCKAFGTTHPEANCMNLQQDGGQVKLDPNTGADTPTSVTVSPFTMYPPTPSATFQTTSRDAAIINQGMKQTSNNGELPSDSKALKANMYASTMAADMMQFPSNVAKQSKAQTLGNTQAASNAMGDSSKAQAASAIGYNTNYLQNFTTDIGNRWNQIRMKLFVPIAILLLVPGAVLAQMKVLKDTTGALLNYVVPFEGIGRAMIAVFAIGASSLVPNYAIDFANAVSDGIANGYQTIVGSNMYEDAIGFQVRGTPVRTPSENQKAGSASSWPQGAINSLATFEKNMIFNKTVGKNGQDQADPDRTDEAMPAGAAMARFASFGMNSALTATWNILCAFQQAYLAYLFFVGPIACALWVWPIDSFRQALPNWVEGCITICFWNLFWNTVILLMACFNGVDTTNTMIMTALNFLATASVKFAFDFAGLVKNAGEQAAQEAMKGGQGGQKGAGGQGGQKGAGAAGGAGGHAAGGAGGHAAGGAAGHGVGAAGLPGPMPISPGGLPGAPPAGVPSPPPSPMTGGGALAGGAGAGGHFVAVHHPEPPAAGASAGHGAVTGGASGSSGGAEPLHMAAASGAGATTGGGGGSHGGGAEGAALVGPPPEAGAADGVASGAAFTTVAFHPGGIGGAHPAPEPPGGTPGHPSNAPMNGLLGHGENAVPPNSIAIQTPNGQLFFSPGQGENGAMLFQANASGGFDAVTANSGPNGAAGGDDYASLTTGSDGNSWNVSYNDVDYNIASTPDGGYNVASSRDGYNYVAEYAQGQVDPNAVHARAANGDGTVYSAYYHAGGTNPDMMAVTRPIADPTHNQNGFQTTYYGRDGVTSTGSVTHLDNPAGGWTENAYGPNGQLQSVTGQTVYDDGSSALSSQNFGNSSLVSSSTAVYDIDQTLVSANQASYYDNGVPASYTQFARDTNADPNVNHVQQIAFDSSGSPTGVVQASFDPSGHLLAGQVNNNNADNIAISRLGNGEQFYAQQTNASGQVADAYLARNSNDNSWTTTLPSANNAPAGPPQLEYLPNVNSMFGQTAFGIEQTVKKLMAEAAEAQALLASPAVPTGASFQPLESGYGQPAAPYGNVVYTGGMSLDTGANDNLRSNPLAPPAITASDFGLRSISHPSELPLSGQVNYSNNFDNTPTAPIVDGYYAKQADASGQPIPHQVMAGVDQNNATVPPDSSFGQVPGGPTKVEHLPDVNHMFGQTASEIERLVAHYTNMHQQSGGAESPPVVASPIERISSPIESVSYDAQPPQGNVAYSGGVSFAKEANDNLPAPPSVRSDFAEQYISPQPTVNPYQAPPPIAPKEIPTQPVAFYPQEPRNNAVVNQKAPDIQNVPGKPNVPLPPKGNTIQGILNKMKNTPGGKPVNRPVNKDNKDNK